MPSPLRRTLTSSERDLTMSSSEFWKRNRGRRILERRLSEISWMLKRLCAWKRNSAWKEQKLVKEF
jgi:hypothetical protein